MKKLAIAGNPNAGKTTLFNLLTGGSQRVGNWPGVTVQKKTGRKRLGGEDVEIVDLPGIYSLAGGTRKAVDEAIATEYLLAHRADLVLNIVDASNLERNLFLTFELREKGIPCVVVLNMMDVARACGRTVNADKLSEALDCPVVPMVGVTGEGAKPLEDILTRALLEAAPQAEFDYDRGPSVEALLDILGKRPPFDTLSRGNLAALLEGHGETLNIPEVQALLPDVDVLAQKHGLRDASIFIRQRYKAISDVTAKVCDSIGHHHTLTERLDSVLLHRFWGIPIFLGVMYLMFFWAVSVGGAFIDFFDVAAGTVLVETPRILLEKLGASEWITFIVADGVGGGLQTVATFIPPILFLFVFLSLLEDSGYMARAAFIVDRLMGALGLPGKAFVPLLVGFGCTVPAVMGTRTLSSVRERIMTIMMAPFMSCGARMPVYALFAVAFFPGIGQNVVFVLYLIGVLVAILTGLVLKRTVLSGETESFYAELPVYHRPSLKNLTVWTWQRLSGFMTKAGKVIVPAAMILTIMNAVGTDGRLGNPGRHDSLLAGMGRAISPVFSPMGLERENWPATVGLFTGLFAKEAVVGTLNVLYSPAEGSVADAADAADDPGSVMELLGGGMKEALTTIPENLAGLAGALADPMGVRVETDTSQTAVADEMGVRSGIFGEMYQRFDGRAGAFAYLLFVLLYAPCLAALGAVYKETDMRWTLFMLGWTCGVAYIFSTVAYQISRIGAAPVSAAGWIAGMLSLLPLAYAFLKARARRVRGTAELSPQSCARTCSAGKCGMCS